jgi:hypothetical protein
VPGNWHAGFGKRSTEKDPITGTSLTWSQIGRVPVSLRTQQTGSPVDKKTLSEILRVVT